MQFIRSQIAAPRPSESRSVALWKQLSWFSASKTSAAELRAILSKKLD
jgi:hypothetical protein